MINKRTTFYFLFFLGLAFLFSYQLTQIPPGINIDESSIGYNASLISRTLHDENGRWLPVFILTLAGRDWKQPIRIYLTALLFKLFGPSYIGLRLVSVLFALVSSFIFFKILRLFFPEKLSFIGLLLFVTSPSILIQSHLALENIDLLPFMLLWLYFLFSYSLKPANRKLLFSGIFLGLSLYAYKGMRVIGPVYLATSLCYLGYLVFKKKLAKVKSISCFLLGMVPFLLPLGWLQKHYAGAIYDPATVSVPSLDETIITYLSAFDFSFLFGTGDKMLVHSTQRHGMFLVPTLILLFLGIIQISKEKKPWFYFIFFSLILTPLLLGSVNSVYRASRLMAYLPLATLIFTLGVKKIFEMKNQVFRFFTALLLVFGLSVSYFDFVKCYWQEYPKWIVEHFSPNFEAAVKQLAVLAETENRVAYFEENDYSTHRSDLNFFQEVYFPQGIKLWPRGKAAFPENALALTSLEGTGELKNFQVIDGLQSGQKTYYIVGKE